ncbi:hypothetical protein [Bifidobacterium sp. ESL0745]|uniref:hypothetical protein n=1 Tax=Bifidobacterium sp. ESL0745 TaxID=2983226 RepID=UPI0023F972DF|nr:hypothetical protein [Bifidobacterium sp. ESL0745]MDF7665828.1 hypothetical protein [Bifidobacterium sp. ESL0745]
MLTPISQKLMKPEGAERFHHPFATTHLYGYSCLNAPDSISQFCSFGLLEQAEAFIIRLVAA